MKTVSTKKTRRAEERDATERFRQQHHRALEALRADGCTLSGLQIWRKLVQLEKLTHAGATASCNGEAIRIVWPLFGPRDYDFPRDEKAWGNLCPSQRVNFRCVGINGVSYSGIYYKSSGNYCRLKRTK